MARCNYKKSELLSISALYIFIRKKGPKHTVAESICKDTMIIEKRNKVIASFAAVTTDPKKNHHNESLW